MGFSQSCVPALLVLIPSLFAAPCAAADSPDLDGVVKSVRSEMNAAEAMGYMRTVYATDRWFTFPKFAETAQILARIMKEIGLRDVEIAAAPADGQTQIGFWTMPMAWDAKRARLEIVEPAVDGEQRVLADFERIPTSLGMWSGSTPADGMVAEVFDAKRTKAADLVNLDLKGKLVLLDQNPANLKSALVRAGAAGAINAFTENEELKDGRQWINAWGDAGWGFTKASTPLLSFSISPRQAAFVRELLARNGRVRVRAVVDSRYYAGEYPYVTGIIPGTGSGEEVLTLGHSSEQGAQDNATGVAAMLESLATLNRLVSSGKLARPRRSIRVLINGELYGSMAYIARNPERVRRTVAAMCMDTPAGPYGLAGTEYTFYLNPHVAKSYVDAFVLRVADTYFSSMKPARPWHAHEFESGTDNYLGEPTVGIPTVWPYSGSGIHTHHNSEDTPEKVDERSLRDVASVNAVYLYFLASAGQREAAWLAEVAANRGYGEIVKAVERSLAPIGTAADAAALARRLADAQDRIAYATDRECQSVESVTRLAAVSPRIAPMVDALRRFGREQADRVQRVADERSAELGGARPVRASRPAENPDATRMVVKRKRFGNITLDDLPVSERHGYPPALWSGVPVTALYWCDGRRSLAEVIRLTQLELGPTNFDFVGYFRFLEKHGYVEFVN